MRENVLGVAREWVGREFRAGEVEQCANFVREVFRQAEVPLGVASRPSDWELTSGLPQGPDYANSLFGDEVGPQVPLDQLQAGDLLAFRNTYSGDFPADCITHVGIYVGENQMIDRSTSDQPVRRIELDDWWRERLCEARRPFHFSKSSSASSL